MDLDADGHLDVITGCWPGKLFIFRGNAQGGFEAPEPILHGSGEPIEPGKASSVFAADWDEDGDLDLLVGNRDGHLCCAVNEGSPGKPRFGRLERLANGDGPITVQGGLAAPCVADWDGDGRMDLVVGTGRGAVEWYRNVGEKGSPALSERVEIVKALFGSGESKAGYRVKIAVADWNGDGHLDLLVGDRQRGTRTKPQLSQEESDAVEAASKRRKELAKRWEEIIVTPRAKGEEGARRDAELRAVVEGLEEIEAITEKARSRVNPDSRLWVFLRKAP